MKCASHKLAAVFGPGNISRVRDIVHASQDSTKLAEIPPSFIVMDITWRCNYHCPCCIDENVVNKRDGELPVELIGDIFDYSKEKGVRGMMTMGGEVFLYKRGIRKALEKSIEHQIPIKTVTNGSALEDFIPEIVEAYKIPGSMLRVSINTDREHYLEHTHGNVELGRVLNSIEKITSQKTDVYVSTVVFPEQAKTDGVTPNVRYLDSMIRDFEKVGAKTVILLPGRNPLTRKRYLRNDEEKKIMQNIFEKRDRGEYKIELGAEEYGGAFVANPNLKFNICPSGFIFTLIGSDGRIYKCTDNRGNDSMVIGRIEKPGDFERFWHSTDRIKAQELAICKNNGCGRYEANCLLNCACDTYRERRIDITDYLAVDWGKEVIFI